MSKAKIYCQVCLMPKLNNCLFVAQSKIACEQCCHKEDIQNYVPLMGDQSNTTYRGVIELCYRCKTKSYNVQCKQCLNKKFCSQCFQQIHKKEKFLCHQAQFSNSKIKSSKLINQYIRQAGTSNLLNSSRAGNDKNDKKQQKPFPASQYLCSGRNKIQQLKKIAELQEKINQAMIKQVRQYWQQKIKETKDKFSDVIDLIKSKQKEFIEVLQYKAQRELQSYQNQKQKFDKLNKQCHNVQALLNVEYFKTSQKKLIQQKIDSLAKQLSLNQGQSSAKIDVNKNNRTFSYAISTNELSDISKILEQMTVRRSTLKEKIVQRQMKKSTLAEENLNSNVKVPIKNVITPTHSRNISNLKKSFQGTPFPKNISSSNLFCQSPKNATTEMKKFFQSPKNSGSQIKNTGSEIKNTNISRVNPQKIRKMKSQKNLTIGSPQKNIKGIMINYK